MNPDPAFERVIRTCSPRKATRQDLAVYHSKAYLDFILDSAQRGEQRDSEYETLKAEFGMEDVKLEFFFLTLQVGFFLFVDDVLS